MSARGAIPVYLERGERRTFACAVDWPGWSRAGKTEADALAALAASAPRYARVAKAARVAFPARIAFDVVERVSGNATTDFGAPGVVPRLDRRPVGRAETTRTAALLAAAWDALDRAAATAPRALRKGPRGGGRDRDAVVAHVFAAECGYAPKIGLRLKAPPVGDRTAIAAHRRAILAGLAASASGPAPDRRWPPAYMARRIAWHVLDHAWEIEDRSG